MGEVSRDERREELRDNCVDDLVEWLLDAEEEIEGWKRVLRMAEDEIKALRFGR